MVQLEFPRAFGYLPFHYISTRTLLKSLCIAQARGSCFPKIMHRNLLLELWPHKTTRMCHVTRLSGIVWLCAGVLNMYTNKSLSSTVMAFPFHQQSAMQHCAQPSHCAPSSFIYSIKKKVYDLILF